MVARGCWWWLVVYLPVIPLENIGEHVLFVLRTTSANACGTCRAVTALYEGSLNGIGEAAQWN
jgi:hypothetical protein